jgi:zinc/manganese transport system permease protein
MAIGLGSTWLGIVISYASYDWYHGTASWPVSFCIVIVVFAAYLLSGIAIPLRARVMRRASVVL